MLKISGENNIVNILKKPPLQLVSADSELVLNKNIFITALDKAVENLNAISDQERESEKLIGAYIKGKAGLDEVMIEIEKANLAINLALTVINTSVQTFKEIMQMPV